MAIEVTELLTGLAAGAVLGALYLGLLRRATARLPGSGAPGLAMLGGAVLRIALVVGGLWLVGAGAPTRLLAGLAGFVVVRQLAIQYVRAGLSGPGEGMP